MKKTSYYQCSLRNRNTYQVAWIPQRFARTQAVLKIRNKQGEWIDGWVVESVGAYSEQPTDIHKAIRGHRDRTGDSTPK